MIFCVSENTRQQEEAAKRLFSIKQRTRPVAKHTIDFRITSKKTRWSKQALIGTFINSFSEQIKDELAMRDEPPNLDDFISLSICIDGRFR